MKFVFTIILVISTGALTCQKGKYVFKSQVKDGQAGSILIHEIPNHGYLFYLEFNVGKPSYNSNAYYGSLNEIKPTVYQYIGIPTIKFTFSEDYTKLEIKGDIRGAVDYVRISENNPQYFITRTGNKIFFNKTNTDDSWE